MKDPVEIRGISPLPHRLGTEMSNKNTLATSPTNPKINTFLFIVTPVYSLSSGRCFNTFSTHYLGRVCLSNAASWMIKKKEGLGALHPLLDAENGGDLPLVVEDLGDRDHQVGLLGLLAQEPVHLLCEDLLGQIVQLFK